MNKLELKSNIKFTELYDVEGLKKIDNYFLDFIKDNSLDIYYKLDNVRKNIDTLDTQSESALIIELAPYLDDFIASLFNIETAVRSLSKEHNELAVLYMVKRQFVQRRAKKIATQIDSESIKKYLSNDFTELEFAQIIAKWMENEEPNHDQLVVAANYSKWATEDISGQIKHKDGVLFKFPNKLDYDNLVSLDKYQDNGLEVLHANEKDLRDRYGFKLTEEAPDLIHTLDQTNYCIHCHHQEKDSCSYGLKEKDGSFKISPTNIKQEGCPLDEKISEMHEVKTKGVIIGSLAIIVIDNPMVAATGNRICNDCMKACVFQKQDPVNIPLAETGILNDVLNLPWGFEIYSLLTRWNPLNFKQYLPRNISDKKILVAGMGPAGFTLSHYLLNQGNIVVAIDGLKIEPLPVEISGITQSGDRQLFRPIYNVRKELFEELDERIAYGFGGVAEYGITVRWDKNYLKIIRLLLERRENFRLYGGIRIGQGLDFKQIFDDYNFDHIALAIGAGRPNILPIKNIMSRGVRTASDFLMSLQLTGAAKFSSIANMQVRLPIVVIGGGLTAIDTATESMAYYVIQVEKFARRYNYLSSILSKEIVEKDWDEEEKIIANEYLDHAKKIAEYKEKNKNLSLLIKELGGVKVLYRKKLQDAPAYRLNHEELIKAFEEGIEFVENVNPQEILMDKYQHACAIKVRDDNDRDYIISAKTILIAAGTNPNITIAKEVPNSLKINGKYYQAINENGEVQEVEKSVKSDKNYVLTNFYDDRAISFFGDLHPAFAGNVVKAMASAKKGYPIIQNLLDKNAARNNKLHNEFFKNMDNELLATIKEVRRLTPTIVEIIIHAPMQAKNFNPGQFYRLQNYEVNNIKLFSTSEIEFLKKPMAMEGIALTGAWVDKEKNIISLIVLEMGGASSLCQYLQKDEHIVLMGPTGKPTYISKNKNILLIGGGLGNAVLFSIGKAMRENGCKILYFAGYKKAEDRYKIEEIEKAADVIVWCCDEKLLNKTRDQDFSYHGNMIQAMKYYAELENTEINFKDINHVITIGSDKLMSVIKENLDNDLKQYFSIVEEKIASINSPMQCMMKEICAQCLQKHVDPISGEEYYVYSCYNQDQKLDSVDFNHLSERLKQNSLQEKLTSIWIKKQLINE